MRIQIKEERDTRGRQEEEEGAMYFEVMSRAKTCLPGGTPGGGSLHISVLHVLSVKRHKTGT